FGRGAIGGFHVIHFQRDVLDTVAMQDKPPVLRVVGVEWRGEYERDVALAQHIARFLAPPRLQSGVGDYVEAEGVAVEVGRLARIAHEETHVVNTAQRQNLLCHSRPPDLSGPRCNPAGSPDTNCAQHYLYIRMRASFSFPLAGRSYRTSI